MVELKKWKGRRTTYKLNGDVHEVVIVYERLSETGPESTDNRMGYFARTIDGRRKFRISPHTVRAENGGLVSKLNS